jgi:hypothetical protein
LVDDDHIILDHIGDVGIVVESQEMEEFFEWHFLELNDVH